MSKKNARYYSQDYFREYTGSIAIMTMTLLGFEPRVATVQVYEADDIPMCQCASVFSMILCFDSAIIIGEN